MKIRLCVDVCSKKKTARFQGSLGATIGFYQSGVVTISNTNHPKYFDEF
jgi:hypothetical protein